MNTLFIGQNTIRLKSVDSTNSYASEILRQNAVPDGTMVSTEEQTMGRGQRGNSWESEPNCNLALSLILYPRFLKTDDQFLITQFTSLAVADLMAELLSGSAEQVKIKWPNDIYVGDRKIAGILIENFIRDQQIHASVIGIGINVNQQQFRQAPNAVSVRMITGQESDLRSVQERLCEWLEPYYLQLKAGQLEKINANYLEKLYRREERHLFYAGENSFQAAICGVSRQGKLQLQLDDGSVKEFDLKEIRFS